MSVGACGKTSGLAFNSCQQENGEAVLAARAAALRGTNQGCALVVLGVNGTAARQDEEALL